MIISWLSGGLGNQMFQYALGRALAIKNHDTLKLDTSSYDSIQENDTPRKFVLDIFNIQSNIANSKEISKLSNSNPIINAFNNYFRTNILSYTNSFIKEESHGFNDNVLQLRGDIYLRGYWQSEQYFDDYVDDIRRDFVFRKSLSGQNKILANNIKNSQSVSLHIRRGDYVSNPNANKFHGTCTLEYYKLAIEFMNDNIKYPIFYIFSDDINWCKKKLDVKNKVVYVEGNLGKDSWIDMRLMSLCKHNIIANSSFSWWGAWLNINKGKIVIAPKKWFLDKSISDKDIIPSTWHRI